MKLLLDVTGPEDASKAILVIYGQSIHDKTNYLIID